MAMASTVSENGMPDTAKAPKARRPVRPNYNYIHRKILPIEVHPLPTLIPHNPLSLIAIALSYLAHIISPPERPTYNGYFSSATSSIHVTDPATVRALWEMGFFGRGNLSRSEPTWLESQRKIGVTAEENTGQRRDERRQQKLERARKEQEEIAEQLSKEIGSEGKRNTSTSQDDNSDRRENVSSQITPELASSGSVANLNGHANGNILKHNASDLSDIATIMHSGDSTPTADGSLSSESFNDYEEWKRAIDANGLLTPPPTSTCSEVSLADSRPVKKLQRQKTVRFSPTIEAREFDLSSPVISPIKGAGCMPVTELIHERPEVVENKEHLHISLEEAFFLSYSLGVFDVFCDNSSTTLPSSSLLSLFRRHSYSVPRSLSVPAEPDDPFMISYAVYHHYRSLGWVVRSGVKFGVDYLLYNRGPAFSHADFAILILPSYSNEYWTRGEAQQQHVRQKTNKTWFWLHGINRVQAQVHKQLVLCYVDVPAPMIKSGKGSEIDIAKELSRYKVRDISVRRWTPNRSRD